jgi:ADP-heptose:LPS heptosyltransferase/GT2 family glycosyltransferase
MEHDVPLLAADLPLIMEVEQPSPDAVLEAGTAIQGFGWALCGEPILSITCHLEDARLCQAVYGLGRTDIAESFAHYPGHTRAGFLFSATLPPWPDGLARLKFTVQTASARHLHTVPIRIGRVPAETLPPPSEPIQLKVEQALIQPEGTMIVTGWAVSLAAIRTVEIRLGDRWLGFATIGQPTEDLAAEFAAYHNAPHAGFTLEFSMEPAQVAACVDQPVSVIVLDIDGRTRSVVLPLQTPAAQVAPVTASLPAVLLSTLEEAHVNDQGVLRVRGWAVGLSTIESVAVHLDDHLVGNAEKSLPRDDVAMVHGGYPNAKLSGFLLQQTLSDKVLTPPGDRTIRIVISAIGGIVREMTAKLIVPPLRRTAAVAAKAQAEVHFHCDDIQLDTDGRFAIKGWAVCPAEIETIRFAIGDIDAGFTSTGDDRPDVGNHFARIPSAHKAGFKHAYDLAQPFSGEHIVSILVRSRSGEERTILQPVMTRAAIESRPTADVAEHTGPIRFFLEAPAIEGGQAKETVSGFMSVNGWAFAGAGIEAIEVFVDGLSQGLAYHGIRREDLDRAFPNSNALLSGFALIVPPQVLRKGTHDVRVVARDRAGHAQETRFTIEAEPAAEGPGPWQLRHKLTQAEVDLQLAMLTAASCRPCFRLVLPLWRTSPADLRAAQETIASLRYHAYPDWRLTIALPASCDAAAVSAGLLAQADDLAPQIDIAQLDPGTSLADLARDGAGPDQPGLLAMLTAGDILGEDALLELSLESAVQKDAAFLYGDERRIDPADGTLKAFFKPDWSPDLLLSTNYIGRFWAASTALLRRCDLRLADFEKRGDYDAVLRLTEQTDRIAHVARVLSQRGRLRPDSEAMERRALRQALHRRRIAAQILPGCLPGSWRCKRDVVVTGKVSIIIPTIASRGLVKITIDSIRAKTAWPDYEIIILDNIPSTASPEQLQWKTWLRENADSVVEIRERFNWSRFNNRGARRARGEFLLFLNDDVEILDESWLHGLLEHAQRPEVGIVGPQLLYPDGRVQHAGVFLSREVGRHAFRFYPRDAPGPFGLALSQRQVISVTGACMLTRRETFDRLGGFDEAHAVINNDLDFALRAHAAGLLNVYTPHVTLIHHEMVSRFKMQDTYNSKHFDSMWKDLFLKGDPYFNPQLTSDFDDYPIEPEPLRRLSVGHPIIAAGRVRRIVAVKVDHIGDFIAAFPAFRRLKQHFPQAELTVVAAKASLALAAMEPAIDRVIEYNFFHARSERGHRAAAKAELQALEQTLAPYRFDLAVDLRRQADTRPLLRVTGARWLAGFDQSNDTRWLDIAVAWEGDLARTFKRTHVTEALVQFVDAVAASCDTDRSVIQKPQLAEDARRILAELPAVRPIANALFARRIVCVHTGAGAVNKQWPAASFAGLLDLLTAQADVNVMVIGGPDEAEFAGLVLSMLRRPDKVFSLVGRTGLRDLPTVLLAAVLYIGNDSGPKHMAASLGVPTIGIHSGTVDVTEWGPMGVHALAIHREMSCSPCYLARASDCHRGLACLGGIKVGDVFRACQRMLLLNPAMAEDAPHA